MSEAVDHILEIPTTKQGAVYYDALLDHVKKTIITPDHLSFRFLMSREEVEAIGEITFTDEQWDVFKQNFNADYFDQVLCDYVNGMVRQQKRGVFS